MSTSLPRSIYFFISLPVNFPHFVNCQLVLTSKHVSFGFWLSFTLFPSLTPTHFPSIAPFPAYQCLSRYLSLSGPLLKHVPQPPHSLGYTERTQAPWEGPKSPETLSHDWSARLSVGGTQCWWQGGTVNFMDCIQQLLYFLMEQQKTRQFGEMVCFGQFPVDYTLADTR